LSLSKTIVSEKYLTKLFVAKIDDRAKYKKHFVALRKNILEE